MVLGLLLQVRCSDAQVQGVLYDRIGWGAWLRNFHDEELGCHWHNYRSSGALRRWSFRKSEATGAIQWSE